MVCGVGNLDPTWLAPPCTGILDPVYGGGAKQQPDYLTPLGMGVDRRSEIVGGSLTAKYSKAKKIPKSHSPGHSLGSHKKSCSDIRRSWYAYPLHVCFRVTHLFLAGSKPTLSGISAAGCRSLPAPSEKRAIA